MPEDEIESVCVCVCVVMQLMSVEGRSGRDSMSQGHHP